MSGNKNNRFMLARLIIIYILNLFDLFFTKYWVNQIGLEFELNPFGKWLLQAPIRQILYKVVLVGVLLIILYISKEKKIANICSWILLGAFGLLTTYHIVGMIIVNNIH